MMSSRQRLLVVEIAAVGVPLVLVYFGRTMLSSAAPASAAVNVSAPLLPPPPGPPSKPLSPEQEKAADWVRLLPATFNLTSPLNHPTDAPPPKPKAVVEPTKVPVRQSPVLGLKLSAVLGNEGDKLASISGRIYRVGDEVRPGLKLTSIDPRFSIITLTDDDGQTYELKRDQK